MHERILIDAFNLFHRWKPTAAWMADRSNLEASIGRSVGALARALGKKRKGVIVVLDGGVSAKRGRNAGLELRWPGPGVTADAWILEALQAAPHPRRVLVVTSDAELAGSARILGASVMTVEKFCRSLGPVRAAPDPEDDRPPEKDAAPSSLEVAHWLSIFGDGSEIEREEG